MAKKKPVQQKKRTESEIERYVRKQFDEAGRFAKRKLGKSNAPMECDLTGNIVKRRRAVVLKYLDTVKERYEKRYPEVDVEKEFVIQNAVLAPSPDVIDKDRHITYAMAIAMLDQIDIAGEMPRVRPFFLHDNDEHREIATPQAVDSCHEGPVIRNMMNLILNRDPVDKDEKHYITEIAAERTELRWEVDFDLDTSYPDDEAITARHRFNIAMSMIDENTRNQAMEKFEAKVWEYYDYYFQNLNAYLSRCTEIGKERTALYEKHPEYAQLFQAVEARVYGASSLTKHRLSEREADDVFMSSFLESGNYISNLSRSGLMEFNKFTSQLNALGDESEYILNCYYRLVDIGPFFPTLSYASLADFLNPEMAILWNKFTIDDPFEICLGYLCLLDSGSDIPWLYNAAQAVLRAAIRKFPWFVLDADLDFPNDDQEDPFGEGEDGEETAVQNVDADPLDNGDETPVVYDHVERKNLYDLCYNGHSDDPFMNILDKVNLPQIVYDASRVIMPRRILFEGDNLNYYMESGMSREEAQFMELYDTLALSMSDRTEDMESFLRSWQHDDFMTLYGLRDEPVDDADDQEAELKRLREELRKERAKSEKLQSQLYAAQKEAVTAKKMAEQVTSETANEHRELLDLREVVFNQENDFEEAEETPMSGVEFPYKNKKRIVAFGGHDTWSKAIRPMLPDVVFVPRGQSPNAEMIRAADEIWIQANALAHKDYYKLMNIARPNHIPVRYFGYASAYKCAVQLAKSDMGDA